jgi:hypothetical protein
LQRIVQPRQGSRLAEDFEFTALSARMMRSFSSIESVMALGIAIVQGTSSVTLFSKRRIAEGIVHSAGPAATACISATARQNASNQLETEPLSDTLKQHEWRHDFA